jgi:hypothetical protein
MIVCHCRNISNQDYESEEELFRRLCERDRDCCACIEAMVRKRKHLTLPTDCCITVDVDTNTED